MHTRNRRWSGWIVAITLIAGLAGTARAADTLIAWSGDMASSFGDLALPSPTDSGTTRTWPYSATVAVTPSSGYSDIPIYGAFLTDQQGTSAGPVDFLECRIRDNGASDDIRFSLNPGSGSTGTIQGLVFFLQEDFANHSDAIVTFDTNSTFFISVTAQGGGSSGSGYGTRAAVLDAGTWYLSDSLASTYGGDIDIDDCATEQWAAWDPTGTPLAPTPSTFNTAGSSFTDIQAVGFYFFLSRGDNISQLWLNEVTVLGVGAPAEPRPGTVIRVQ